MPGVPRGAGRRPRQGQPVTAGARSDRRQGAACDEWHESVVWIPKHRRKAACAELRDLGSELRRLARQGGPVPEKDHVQLDHVHMLPSIPPKCPVAEVLGYLKGKRAILIGGGWP